VNPEAMTAYPQCPGATPESPLGPSILGPSVLSTLRSAARPTPPDECSARDVTMCPKPKPWTYAAMPLT
jgi:hypothetical protein